MSIPQVGVTSKPMGEAAVPAGETLRSNEVVVMVEAIEVAAFRVVASLMSSKSIQSPQLSVVVEAIPRVAEVVKVVKPEAVKVVSVAPRTRVFEPESIVKSPVEVESVWAPMNCRSSSRPMRVSVEEVSVGIALVSRSRVIEPLFVSPAPVKTIDPLSASPISIVSLLAPVMSPHVKVASPAEVIVTLVKPRILLPAVVPPSTVSQPVPTLMAVSVAELAVIPSMFMP